MIDRIDNDQAPTVDSIYSIYFKDDTEFYDKKKAPPTPSLIFEATFVNSLSMIII